MTFLLKKQHRYHTLEILEKATSMLQHSYATCKILKLKEKHSLSGLDLFAALNNRFARFHEIIIRKMLRTIDQLDIEPEGTVPPCLGNNFWENYIHT